MRKGYWLTACAILVVGVLILGGSILLMLAVQP